jgi:hypothetical protein
MNEFLRDRIARKLDSLNDERLYQVLDYVEFLESKYAERQNPSGNIFTRFAETVEDKLRAGKVSASTIAETMNLMNKAMGVLGGVAAAGKSVASDIVGAAKGAVQTTGTPPAGTPGSAPSPAGSSGTPGSAAGSPPAQPAAPPPPRATGGDDPPAAS